ncbi:hypothetical protein P4H66_23520 [Paenibacillus dokdonensis]|uniref:Transglycosylase n=1 Tax=Paenibacillus dokdonensis TaxID=2567944 RepID=A0ABU6GVP7_9BACL|nr:hypothetical protein [Paenibacillus dokdonensis]MEC0242785.1 hypothetical protein [Paenibacillus dokdonensis]
MKTSCDASCKKPFEVEEFQTDRISGGIEKVYFSCPHCQQEYVAFYTDPEIRELQVRIRRVQQRFANPKADIGKVAQREAEIKAQIKEKMNALRARIEGGGYGK